MKLQLLLSITILLISYFLFPVSARAQGLWEYQCIDTMKTSRDKARAWKDRTDLQKEIDNEVKAVTLLGANCIAIATPYDEEFYPYLNRWVTAARAYNLHIWFRGNFSSWEGWFDYPTGMDEQALFSKTKTFISAHPDLFEDGDIFTAAPEGENGGPFNQVEKNEYDRFRKFLLQENEISKASFDAISKNVTVNWFSMNGGLAKRMLDQPTVDGMDTLVTIDHYIKTPQEMGEFIDYFYKTFSTPVVIGEFGAPIPEINGVMSDDEQANFVDSLFKELYKKKSYVRGVNYWTLSDGSTALLHEDLSEKPVAEVIKKYFNPYTISLTVQNTLGEKVSNVSLHVPGTEEVITTDEAGHADIMTPEPSTTITFEKDGYTSVTKKMNLIKKESFETVAIQPTHPGILYTIRSLLLTVLH